MTDEKTVELTEAEKDMLDAAYDSDFLGLVEVVESIVTAREIAAEQAGREDNALHEMCYVSGSKALEAREAAARREAEDDPAHARMYRALLERAERAEAKVERVEALAEEWASDLSPDSRYTRNVLVHELRAALAEPERDEEGGR